MNERPVSNELVPHAPATAASTPLRGALDTVRKAAAALTDPRVAALIAPLRVGVSFLDGWVLLSAQGDDEVQLRFARGQLTVTAVVTLRDDNVPAYARTRYLNVIARGTAARLDASKSLLKALTAVLSRNETRVDRGFLDPVSQLGAGGYADFTVDLQISTACQNRCVFCTDRPVIIKHRPTGEVKELIVDLYAKGYRAIDFGAMEPTLRKDFLELVEHAYGVGFVEVRMITNGIRTAEWDYALAVCERGITMVTLSIHGSDQPTEYAITKRSESYRVKMQTLENFKRLRAERAPKGLNVPRIVTNSVVCTDNLHCLSDLCRLLDGYDVEQQRYYHVQPQGNALTDAATVLPTVADMKAPLLRLCETARTVKSAVRLMDFPLCVINDPLVVPRGPKDILTVWDGLGYEGVNRDDKGTFRCHGPQCRGCSLRNRCGGIWSGHVLTHGWTGIQPPPE